MSIALYLVLGLSALVDLALGVWASVSWGSFVTAWRLSFGESGGDPRLLGLVLGLALLFFAALQVISLWWIRAEKEAGHWIAISFGFYLMLSSLITFLVFRHRADFLLVDGLRGALLVILSTVNLRAPATVRELRLPDKGSSERPRHRAAEDRPRGRDRRGDRGRGPSDRRPQSRRERPASSAGRQEESRSSAGRHGGESDRRPSRDQRGAGPGRGEGESRRPEKAPPSGDTEAGSRVWSRSGENRGRTPEELLASDSGAPRRARPGGSEERSLTVVVKGDPDALRVRSLDEVASAFDGHAEPSAGAPEDREPSGDRRRRRRRHRSRPGAAEGRGSDGQEPPIREERESPGREARRVTPERVPAEDANTEPGSMGSSGVVEAFDMLSLLDPASGQSGRTGQPFGRRSKRVAQRRPISSASSKTDADGEERRTPGSSLGTSSESTDGHPPGEGTT